MKTAASFPAVARSGSATTLRPVVFVRDHPEPTLRVRRIAWSSPLDEVGADIDSTTPLDSSAPYFGQPAYVATPRLLRDGQTRWQVFAVGRLEQPQRFDAATQHHHRLVLTDRWTDILSRSPSDMGHTTKDPVAHPSPPSSVGEALQQLANHHGIELLLHSLPSLMRDEPLLQAFRLNLPLRNVLETLLEDHKLVVRRELTLAAGRVAERLSVRPMERGRSIQLPFTRTGQSVSPVTTFESTTQPPRARLWVARGGRPRIESTFVLVPGWDPTLENRPDADYNPSQSSDFSRFGNVYRRWVLNEDASRDGPAFDLAALFDQPNLAPAPIVFGDCLTLDDAGRPLPPIVEFSTDAGANWSRLTDPASFMNDRAGLTLDSIALPASILAAAKNGSLQLRVTASLISPEPIIAQRWQGNPFADVGPEMEIDASDSFAVQQISPGSLHAAAVQAGQLTAELRDDSAALADWLLRQIDRDIQAAVNTTARARLTLANARPEIRPGDRLDEALPHGRDINGGPATLPSRTATVTEVRCDFAKPAQTVLTLRA